MIISELCQNKSYVDWNSYRKRFNTCGFKSLAEIVRPVEDYPISIRHYAEDWSIIAHIDSSDYTVFLQKDKSIGRVNNSKWDGMIKWVTPNNVEGLIMFEYFILSKIKTYRDTVYEGKP